MMPNPPQDHLGTLATQDRLLDLACGQVKPVDETVVRPGVIKYLAEDIYRVTDAVFGLGELVHKLNGRIDALEKSQSARDASGKS